MLKEYTCIICPAGCEITADIADGKIVSIKGATCQRGEAYVLQELTDPQRNIASSVSVRGGTLPLASVRLTGPIPKDRIFDVMDQIKRITLDAPVSAGQIAVKNILNLGQDVIVTKHVPLKESASF